ncbi:site-specific recombinase XerD [Bacteroides sp. CAG:443]|nr:site-specific recombinase XerD [Bacteroides sp. CAG:443]
MTRIKIKLRLSTVSGRAGTVYYQISRKKEVRQITTDIHLLPEEWDASAGCVCKSVYSGYFRLSAIQHRIDREVEQLRQIIRTLELSGGDFSARTVVEYFCSSRKVVSVLSYGQHLISRLTEKGKLGSARNLRCTLSSFADFLHGKDIALSMLDEVVVGEYADWLAKRGITSNSSSFYMRNLRSVYNRAVREEGIEQTFPFRYVYTGIDKTAKRSVDEKVIIRLKGLELNDISGLGFARDLFLFSYCTRGMSFVDMAYLRHKDIRNGYICYKRKKTGRPLSIRIEQIVQEIINRYQKRTTGSCYLFPILHTEDDEQSYKQYQTGLRYYNKQLKKLASLLGEDIVLTSYTSRHTWASTARKHNVPVAVISDGMGHTSEKTTLIYLSSIDTSVIDRANAELVASLNRKSE